MFDIGWSEMLIIGVIAIVVVGPKDLPRMMRTVGQYVGKAKRMAREFQTQFDDAVRDSELGDVRQTFNDLKSANPTTELGKSLNPLTEAAEDVRKTVEESDADDDKYGTGFENAPKPKTVEANADENSIAGPTDEADKSPATATPDAAKSKTRKSKATGSKAAKPKATRKAKPKADQAAEPQGAALAKPESTAATKTTAAEPAPNPVKAETKSPAAANG